MGDSRKLEQVGNNNSKLGKVGHKELLEIYIFFFKQEIKKQEIRKSNKSEKVGSQKKQEIKKGVKPKKVGNKKSMTLEIVGNPKIQETRKLGNCNQQKTGRKKKQVVRKSRKSETVKIGNQKNLEIGKVGKYKKK